MHSSHTRGPSDKITAMIRSPAPVLALWYFLPAMGLILIASTMVFVVLVRRWTVLRRQTQLSLWTREADFRPVSPPAGRLLMLIPAPLRSRIRIDQAFCREQTWLAQLMSADPLPAPRNLLLRQLPMNWPPTALRPAQKESVLIDPFNLRHFPALSTPNRFGVYATTAAGARALATSPIVGLLPPDLGLLLEGGVLLLDFSARTFDPIELDRLTALVDQLVRHLPVAQTVSA